MWVRKGGQSKLIEKFLGRLLMGENSKVQIQTLYHEAKLKTQRIEENNIYRTDFEFGENLKFYF